MTRPILELRAEIDQGDSGGPLVLADGTVGGVVFAEARTDEEVGYALDADVGAQGDRAGARPDGSRRDGRLHPLRRGSRAYTCPRVPDRARGVPLPCQVIRTTRRPIRPSATRPP